MGGKIYYNRDGVGDWVHNAHAPLLGMLYKLRLVTSRSVVFCIQARTPELGLLKFKLNYISAAFSYASTGVQGSAILCESLRQSSACSYNMGAQRSFSICNFRSCVSWSSYIRSCNGDSEYHRLQASCPGRLMMLSCAEVEKDPVPLELRSRHLQASCFQHHPPRKE
ncbi:uncharacterized protein HD556DRAFT_1384876 [Suillus plorans]|uniref:Uncharacterized protein n=1 Tax=Suillus plorans TaxID=116603 RepID=A0A9P7DG48_9AGAM|nr:uncharacterized protein HD556DRAFT_1384876 [Suillus plorans]KAG1791521.1 hypothetical protein HD556DRAFT_1384876 [Suillus plorans]